MKLHSVVHLITNSSSETYMVSAAGAREAAIRCLDSILEILGVPFTAEEVFEIEYVISEQLIHTGSIEVDFINENYSIQPPLTTVEQAREWLFEYGKEHGNHEVEICGYDEDAYKVPCDLVINVKTQFRAGLPTKLAEANIANMMRSLFDCGTYGIN